MSLVPRSVATTPSDGGSLFDAGPGNVTFATPAGAALGDLIEFTVARRASVDIVIDPANNGGQSWILGTLRQNGALSVKKFFCRFNGTWTGTVQILTVANGAATMEGQMIAVPPTLSSNTWAVDVAEQATNYIAPNSPFDVTRAGQTSIASSTITIASFISLDKNTWLLQAGSGGWANAGLAQYRAVDSVSSRNLSMSHAYKAQSVAGATGSAANRQATLGGDPGITMITTYKEQGSGVTVSDAQDALFHHGETGIVLTGTTFGASKGAGDVILSPTNNIADGSAVSQSTSAWSDTQVTLGALSLSSFPYFTNLYLFVKNNSGQSNATGFIVQREPWMSITGDVLKNLAGSAQANLSGLDYRVTATSVNGALLLSGSTESTDGSGNIVIGPYVLTNGGPLIVGDDVWLVLAKNGASQALSPGTSVKLTPTYT